MVTFKLYFSKDSKALTSSVAIHLNNKNLP